MGIVGESVEVLDAVPVDDSPPLSLEGRLDRVEDTLNQISESLTWLVSTVQMIATVAQTMAKGGGIGALLGAMGNHNGE